MQHCWQKKSSVNSASEDGVQCFDVCDSYSGSMPSTGDVKMLVLAIEFKDEKFDKEIYNGLQECLFGTQDVGEWQRNPYKDLSVSDYYKKVSFNKLRLSGTVLPIYSATKNRDEYTNDHAAYMNEIANAISLFRDKIGDLSAYDSNNDGYSSVTKEIDIYASDAYNEESLNQRRAIAFFPNGDMSPFGEFYIMEYRVDKLSLFKDQGVMIWHINTKRSYLNGLSGANYIQPVFKSGSTSDFKNNDLYRTGDKWSAYTNPSSDLYDGYKTGAFMEVLSMDNEKATVRVGYEEEDFYQAPTVSITGENENYTQYGKDYGRVKFACKYDNAYSIMGVTAARYGEKLSQETIDKYVELETTGNIKAQIDYENCSLSANEGLVIWVKGIEEEAIKGAGTVRIHLKEGCAVNGSRKSDAATSPAVEVLELDKTPPKVEVIFFPSERTRGKVIAYFHSDEEITPTQRVFDYNANLAGVQVFDMAGNRTLLDIKVNWIDNNDKTLLPQGILHYSTKEATNQDVTVILEPLESVKESSDKLTYTFTENGEHTFSFTDIYGNVNQKTVAVDWIDKNATSQKACSIISPMGR